MSDMCFYSVYPITIVYYEIWISKQIYQGKLQSDKILCIYSPWNNESGYEQIGVH